MLIQSFGYELTKMHQWHVWHHGISSISYANMITLMSALGTCMCLKLRYSYLSVYRIDLFCSCNLRKLSIWASPLLGNYLAIVRFTSCMAPFD